MSATHRVNTNEGGPEMSAMRSVDATEGRPA